MEVKVINKSNHNLPSYATDGSAGIDLKANIDSPISLHPGDRVLIPTGLYMAIPDGYAFLVCPRSGLALKQGITVCNAPGVVDADFRNEVGVVLINLGKEVFIINPGDRIAQGVLSKVEHIDWQEVTVLPESNRKGGFGSTGK